MKKQLSSRWCPQRGTVWMIVHLVDRSKKTPFPFNCSQTFREIRCCFFCFCFFFNDVLKSLLPLFLFWVSINNKRDAEINTITSKDWFLHFLIAEESIRKMVKIRFRSCEEHSFPSLIRLSRNWGVQSRDAILLRSDFFFFFWDKALFSWCLPRSQKHNTVTRG